jgi:hypothetical protein
MAGSVVWVEAPLHVAVRAVSPHPTARVAAVASVLALELVAPFARVTLLGRPDEPSDADMTLDATEDAFGVLVDGGGPDAGRSLANSELEEGLALVEDLQGRWFRSDDDGQKVELTGHTAWALTGAALASIHFHPTSPGGGRLLRALQARDRDTAEAEGLRRASLDWASGEIDRALVEVSNVTPARVRRWLTELSVEHAHLRGAHDALRGRYERSRATVDGEPDGG